MPSSLFRLIGGAAHEEDTMITRQRRPASCRHKRREDEGEQRVVYQLKKVPKSHPHTVTIKTTGEENGDRESIYSLQQ